jgi:hypothetical protein
MTAAILEAAEILVVHQADVARLRAFDDYEVVFVEVFALVNELHVPLRGRMLAKAKITMSVRPARWFERADPTSTSCTAEGSAAVAVL